jgi:small secreted domain DUF320
VKLMHKGAVLAALAGGIMLGTSGVATADSYATGYAVGSPGVLSGNLVQVPIDAPVNICGNSVTVIGLLNPAFRNVCSNADGYRTWHGQGRAHQDSRSHTATGKKAGRDTHRQHPKAAGHHK